MYAKLILMLLFLGSCFAWMRPERCRLEENHSRLSRAIGTGVHFSTVVGSNITEEVEKTKKELDELYKDYRYSKNPVKAYNYGTRKIRLTGPIECSLNTEPEKLTTFVCQPNVTCTITHTVSTVDTYTAQEGYNWGVKVSAKFSIIEKIFEVGGEVSVGGSYSCSFNKGKITTETVQCAKPLNEHGTLELYNIKTQMYCTMGTYKTKYEERQGSGGLILKTLTDNEYYTILENSIKVLAIPYTYMLDTDNVPGLLLEKLKKEAPLFNPNTDIMFTTWLSKPQIGIDYYTIVETSKEYVKNVPLTNKDGNMHHTYVCAFTPR